MATAPPPLAPASTVTPTVSPVGSPVLGSSTSPALQPRGVTPIVPAIGVPLTPAPPECSDAPAEKPCAPPLSLPKDASNLRPYAQPAICDPSHANRLLSKTLSSHVRWCVHNLRKGRLHTQVLDLSGLYPNLTELMKLCNTLALVQAKPGGVTTVRMSGIGLRDDCRSTLKKWLEADVCLTSLDLSCNWLRKSAAKALAATLATNSGSQVSALNLACNDLREGGVQHIATLLSANHPPLTSLILAGNNMRAGGAEALAAAVTDNTTLTHLDLSSNHMVTARCCEALANVVANSSTLQRLDIANNRLKDDLPRLMFLPLRDSPSLRHLSLDRCELSVLSGGLLARIVSDCGLTALDLSHNHMSGVALVSLLAELATNTTLGTLLIPDCVDMDPGHSEALATGLRTNTTLHTLDVSMSRWQGSALSAVFGAITSNKACALRNITLQHDRTVPEEVVAALQAHPQLLLTGFRFGGSPDLIAGTPTLQALALVDANWAAHIKRRRGEEAAAAAAGAERIRSRARNSMSKATAAGAGAGAGGP